MKVAVLYSMLPKDLQERVLDACFVAWDGCNETDAGDPQAKVKAQVENFATARREMAGPNPMEGDRVATSWADWSLDCWGDYYFGNWANTEKEGDENTKEGEKSYVQFVVKGDGKSKGKWLPRAVLDMRDFGHSQRFCAKGKGKGFDKGNGKGYGKDSFKGGFQVKGFGKDYGWYGKGKGDSGKSGDAPQLACFGCGST
jgi:hypothetical protein